MKKLKVIYAGWGERWTLGTLADTGQQILFEYSPQARQQPCMSITACRRSITKCCYASPAA